MIRFRHAAATAAVLGLVGFTALPRAEAFCGFYISGADAKLFNNATQVVLMREGTRTVLSMQNNYEGPPESFAMVVPVPVVLQKENVKTLPRDIFAKVDALSAPRLVEYWEQDPCAPPVQYAAMAPGAIPAPAPMAAVARGALGVKIEAQFTVGEYDIVILSAKDSGGLDTWLRQEHYKIPDGAEPFLRPYVQAGSKFFVAKVDPKKVRFEGNQAMLSPLRFHYDSEQFQLPVRLGLMNAKGAQDLIVNVLAKGQRYEVANYPNVTVPTNLDVTESARSDFGTFYASLFDKTLEKNPKAVVTEYSWSADTCDPCPGPSLSPSDLATLGGDAMPGATPPPSPLGHLKANGQRLPPGPTPARPPSLGGYGGFTITRLHARYTKDSLGEDLVFRAAAPIEGGREFMTRAPNAKPDDRGTLEHGSRPSQYGQNQFQGRYAIRHPWTGPVACEHPNRGIWGGPPDGIPGTSAAKPALNLAFAKRKPAQLASFLRTNANEIGVVAQGAPVSPANATLDGGAAVAAAPSAVPSANPPAAEAPAKGGCAACSTEPAPLGEVGLGLGAIAFLGALSRRRGGSR